MNYIKALGDLVKAERIKLGFTQSELAKNIIPQAAHMIQTHCNLRTLQT